MAWMSDADLIAFCRADRDRLLAAVGAAPDAVPAELLGDIIESVLHMHCLERYMESDLLGACDFDARTIYVNARLAEIALPNTNLRGLENSTRAHEIGHVRFPDHEREIRAELDGGTLSLFGEPTAAPVRCRRDWHTFRRLSKAEQIRERQADVYASVLLVPETLLRAQPGARTIEQAARERKDLTSRELWALAFPLAEFFQVTGALMARRLAEMGWIIRRGRNLAIHPQELLPL